MKVDSKTKIMRPEDNENQLKCDRITVGEYRKREGAIYVV